MAYLMGHRPIFERDAASVMRLAWPGVACARSRCWRLRERPCGGAPDLSTGRRGRWPGRGPVDDFADRLKEFLESNGKRSGRTR